MRKLCTFVSVLLLLSAAAFAEVKAKKLDDGKIEATFFYASTTAQEVKVAGDFTNWGDGALTMTKTDTGFTLVKVFDAGTTLKYKFIVDGEWTSDPNAPDSVDDGFGGMNGLANLDELSAPAVADAEGGEKAKKSKMHFGTFTVLGAEMKGETGKNSGVTAAGLGLKSYFKVSTEFLPSVPVYLEVAVAENDACNNLYKRGSGTNENPELTFVKGFERMGYGLMTAPFYWLGGDKGPKGDNPVKANDWTYLGHFKFGIDSKWAKWETGAKYAKVPEHKINDWRTVHEWDAGWGGIGGYNYFELGSALQKIGDNVVIKAALSPNMNADKKGNRYGLFSWVDVELFKKHTISLEYDGSFNNFKGDNDWSQWANGGENRHDIIAGYNGKFGHVTALANMLLNVYPQMEKVPAQHKMAFLVSVKYKQGVVDNLKVWSKLRGNEADLIYAGKDDHKNDDLGGKNKWTVGVDTNFVAVEGVKLGTDLSVSGRFDKSDNLDKAGMNDKDNVRIANKLHFDIEFKPLVDFDGKLSGYAKMEGVTQKADRYYRGKEASDDYASQFLMKDIGLKFSQNLTLDVMKNYAVTLDWDNTNDKVNFLTLLGELEFAKGYKAHAGLGARIPNKDVKKNDEVNPVGFFIGMSKKFENARAGKPLFFAGFAFAMKPYKDFADGVDMKRDDYRFENGAMSDYNKYILRVGAKWDF